MQYPPAVSRFTQHIIDTDLIENCSSISENTLRQFLGDDVYDVFCSWAEWRKILHVDDLIVMAFLNQRKLQAMEFAKNAHKGQKRDDGKPYDTHLDRVAKAVDVFLPNDPNAYMAAWLHDVVEDTEVTIDQVSDIFGQDVAFLVECCTDAGEKDNFGKYFPNLRPTEEYTRATIIKKCDAAHNISDMETWDTSRKEHMLRKRKDYNCLSPEERICFDTKKLNDMFISHGLNKGSYGQLINAIQELHDRSLLT